jgi:hypothetical protein
MLSIGTHGSLPAVPNAVPGLILRSSIRDYRTWLRLPLGLQTIARSNLR